MKVNTGAFALKVVGGTDQGLVDAFTQVANQGASPDQSSPDQADQASDPCQSESPSQEDAGEVAPEAKSEAMLEGKQADEEFKLMLAQEDRFWAEVDLIRKMATLDERRKELESQIATERSLLAEIKSKKNEAEGTISGIEDEMKQITDEFMGTARDLCVLARGGTLAGVKKPDQPNEDTAPQPTVEDEGWRNYPTEQLLSDIKGQVKRKKALIAEAPTVGHLQDMRAKASLDCVDFHNMMPQGCGAGFAELVESRMHKWIGDWALGRHKVNLEEMLSEVRASADECNWTKDDCQPKSTDSESLHAGFKAFGEGRPYSDAQASADPKQWLVGWVSHERLAKLVA